MKNVKPLFFTALFLLGLGWTTIATAQDASEKEKKEKKDDDWEDWDDWDRDIDFKYSRNGNTIRFFMLDLGVSAYLFNDGFNIPSEIDSYDLLYGGSNNINLHVFRQRIGKTIGLEYGLTFSWMQYKFADNFELQTNQPEVTKEFLEGEFRKNKLKTTFIQVPLMVTISPFKRKSYFISGGAYAAMMLSAKQKLKRENGDVTKIKDDFNLNKFRYGIEGRIGLGPISFYGQYSLVELFKDGQGPELFPINIGVTFLNF